MLKKHLEIKLQRIPPIPNPKPNLEQYSTPSEIATDILYIAYFFGDIEGKKVCDLGCGTGIFSIGAKILGAKKVVGIDIDENAIKIAKKFAKKFKLKIDFRSGDIKKLLEKFDTVIQNPPFGSQKRKADRIFLEKAMEIAKVVYTLHNAKTVHFIRKFVKGKITFEKKYKFKIRYLFNFHKKEEIEQDVIFFRIENL